MKPNQNELIAYNYKDTWEINDATERLISKFPMVESIFLHGLGSSPSPQQQLNNTCLALLGVCVANGYTLAHAIDTLRGMGDMMDNFVEAEFG